MRENLLPDVPDPALAGPGPAGSGAPIQEQRMDPPRNQTLSIAIPR
ncbi:hypothetical protein WJ968_00440 [Achromobacter xylosoxidans]